MAQFTKKKKGWTVRFYSEKLDQNGDKERVYLSGYKTKKDAEKGMSEYLNALIINPLLINNKMTVKSFFEYWFDNYVISNIELTTQEVYRINTVNHILPMLGNVKLKELNPGMIQSLYTYKLQELSPATVKKLHVIIHSALEKAKKWGFIPTNISDMVQPPKVETKEVTLPPLNIMKDILNDVRINRPNAYIPCLFAVYTGLRRGEVCGLQNPDIDITKKTVTVINNYVNIKGKQILKTPKTKKSKRQVYLFDDIIPILNKYIKQKDLAKLNAESKWQNNDFFFVWLDDGRPYKPDYLYRSFKKSATKFGYPDLTFHKLRHFYASMLLNRTDIPVKAIQDSLGHSNKEMMDIYGHLMNDVVHKIYEGKTLGLTNVK